MAAIDQNFKTCKVCNQMLSTSLFYKQTQRSDSNSELIWEYYDTLCKSCRKNEAHIRRKSIKKQSVLYKGGKCEHCLIEDSCMDIYDFHHVNPKNKDFSIGKINAKSFEKIRKELDKCVLLCANCHRKVHSS